VLVTELKRQGLSYLPITFQLLRFCQPSGLNSPAACRPVKILRETKLPMFLFQHRLARLPYQFLLVSDGTSLLGCKRSVGVDEIVLADWLTYYTYASFSVKGNSVISFKFFCLTTFYPGQRSAIIRVKTRESREFEHFQHILRLILSFFNLPPNPKI
jgi:hypothetical protein